jgi:hypothetical protein
VSYNIIHYRCFFWYFLAVFLDLIHLSFYLPPKLDHCISIPALPLKRSTSWVTDNNKNVSTVVEAWSLKLMYQNSHVPSETLSWLQSCLYLASWWPLILSLYWFRVASFQSLFLMSHDIIVLWICAVWIFLFF